MMREETISLGERSYTVVVGKGARTRAVDLLPPGAKRVAVVTQSGVPSRLVPNLGSIEVSHHEIGTGENHKTLSTSC